ncbi:PstS family phosphate ABC transporter substrate-binding protein [Paramuribaculum intestinale]|uniref:PstS family phosphate ABC transporter substrate-binding protein n=1 Tax=Paramuribaculum intestinale TaxID=2094151 RepID=UPI0025B6EE5B|nr:substrate-binding domain-containing protein [Paramuribaculum intestinale]
MKYISRLTPGVLSLGAALLLGVALSSCAKEVKSTASSGIAQIACDASFENIMNQEIDVFEYIYPKASIMPVYTSQNAVIDSLLDVSKTADTRLGVLTRPLTQKEVDYLKSNGRQVRQSMIAVDALALIVNPQNRVQVLSKPEIAEILSGQLTEWNQVVPGNDHLGKIEVVFDHQGSSTVQYMRDSLLNGGQFGPNVYAQKTPADVFKAVRENKNAVGVIGVSWISSDLKTREMSRKEFAASVQSNDSVSNSADMRFSEDVKVIKVRGNDEVTAYMPYQLYIFDGSYPLYRQIYMVCTATGGTISHGFYSFVTGFHGQKIMMTTGVLPRVVQPTLVNIN